MAIRWVVVAMLGCAGCHVDVAIGPGGVAVDALDHADVALAEVIVDAAADVPVESDAIDAANDLALPDVPGAPDSAGDLADSAAPADVAQDAVFDPKAAGMVLIPAGTFWMGCNWPKDLSCQDNEKPQHKVTLSAYYIDLTETTVGQYEACVDAGGCTASLQGGAYLGQKTYPVNFVDWSQSHAFCKWRGAAFDLPTEAQWEMAARGSCELNGSTADDPACAAAMRTYPWGEATPTCEYVVAQLNDGECALSGLAAVGSKPAGDSPYGLHDMAGNVWEWCRDAEGPYQVGPQFDPTGSAGGPLRLTRGGSYGGEDPAFDYNGTIVLRAANRDGSAPYVAADDLGFRCIRAYP